MVDERGIEMSNEEILKLAESMLIRHLIDDETVEAFYRAAFTAGLEAAAKRCEAMINSKWVSIEAGNECAEVIRALKEMK
jgi:hypothetical protein